MLNNNGIDCNDRLFQATQVEPKCVAEDLIVTRQNLHGILEHRARICEAAQSGNDRNSGGWTHARPSQYSPRTVDDFMSFEGSSEAIHNDKIFRISLRSLIASRVSDDAGLPAPWWGAADKEPQTLRRSASRSWSAERSGYGTRKGTDGGRYDGSARPRANRPVAFPLHNRRLSRRCDTRRCQIHLDQRESRWCRSCEWSGIQASRLDQRTNGPAGMPHPPAKVISPVPSLARPACK